MFKNSIRKRLIAGILLPILIVYVSFIIYETGIAGREAIRHAGRFLTESTGKHASQCDAQFYADSQIAVTTADVLTALDRLPSGEELEALLRQSLSSNPHIAGQCIAFEPNMYREGLELFAPYVCRLPDGTALRSSDLGAVYPADKDYTTWEWYENSRKNRDKPLEEQKGSWCEAYFDQWGGDVLMCTFSAPFFREGRFAGVATVDISLDHIRSRIMKISPGKVTYRLFNSRGTLVGAPRRDRHFVMTETVFSLAEKYRQDSLAEIGRNMLAGKSGVVRYEGVIDDEKVWVAYAPLPFTGGALMASIPESVIMAPVRAQLIRSLLALLLVLLSIAGIIVAVSYRLTMPLKKLTAFADELSRGNLDAQVGDIPGNDEIGQLVKAFDKMAVDLRSNINRLIREESARKTVEGELRVARRIQASLLPRIFPPFPERTEFELHAMNEPAAFVAGDFFDFFFIDRDTLALIVADVSGHGIPAALFMAVSRTALRYFSLPDLSPGNVMEQANTLLNTDNDDMMFVTVFYGHYNVATGRLVYVNAGHNPPYLVRSDGKLESLEPTGPLLAAFEDASYEEREAILEKDDLLVLFTDGVTEAHSSRDNDLFGERRLEQLIREIRDAPVETICNEIYGTVDLFGRHERHDDVTLMVLKRNE